MRRQRPQRHLDNHLTLHAWINSLFGYNTTRDLLNDVNKHVGEDFNPNGHHPICEFLSRRLPSNSPTLAGGLEGVSYPPDKGGKGGSTSHTLAGGLGGVETLQTYDTNIKRHLAAINNTRTQPIVLRYFQYLALLYTEICLDWKFNRPDKLLHHLNAFVQHRNDAQASGDAMDTPFTETDLEKLAFWMATGAGKTPHHAY